MLIGATAPIFRFKNYSYNATVNLYFIGKRGSTMMVKVKEDCKDVAGYWKSKMPMMAMEECAELIQAISKWKRNGRNTYEEGGLVYTREGRNLVEEMGDVIISIGAMLNITKIPEDDLNDYITEKLSKKYD